MTITPGTPEDWADTNPETAEPERILPIPEGVTPAATKVAMVCYAVGAASKCWEHPERAGVFDSDRASQIVTELCEALGMEQQGDTASESARGGCMADFDAPQAPGQGEDSLSPSEPVFIDPATLAPGTAVEIEWPTIRDRFLYYADEGGYQITAGKVGNGDPYPWKDGRIVRVFTEDKPMQEPVLPRRIEPGEVRVGMVVERRRDASAYRDRVTQVTNDADFIDAPMVNIWSPSLHLGGWELWLIERLRSQGRIEATR